MLLASSWNWTVGAFFFCAAGASCSSSVDGSFQGSSSDSDGPDGGPGALLDSGASPGGATGAGGGRSTGGTTSAGGSTAPTGRCNSDKDCTPLGKLCDLRLQLCVTCVSDTDCGTDATCRAGTCQSRIGCGNSLDCVDAPDGRLVCDAVTGDCVQCAASTDCERGQTCRASVCTSTAPAGSGGASTGSCAPSFCPALGAGRACCLAPNGPCGMDYGMGCIALVVDGGRTP